MSGFQPTRRGTEASSFLEQLLTGVIKNWKGGVPPDIMPKGNKHIAPPAESNLGDDPPVHWISRSSHATGLENVNEKE